MTVLLDVLRTADGEVLAPGLVTHASVLSYDSRGHGRSTGRSTRDTRSMRRLHRIVETRSGRLFARRVLRTRISPYGWDPLPASQECVASPDLVDRLGAHLSVLLERA